MKWTKRSKDTHSLHKFALLDMDDDFIYLRNPHGDAEKGSKPGDRRPAREAIPDDSGKSGGHIKMEKQVFYDNLNTYHIPIQ
jgi:uncharacterized protein YvpB